jgi:hypothetical protein
MNTRVIATALLSLLAACGEALPPTRVTSVVQSLALAREREDGTSVGFDLDGQASDTLDARSCNKQDFVDPSGAKGIDNQMARLMPLIDIAGQGAVDSLIQQAISAGRLLMFTHVDTTEDGVVHVVFERGQDEPLVGSDGLLLAGQTLARHPEPLLGEADAALEASGSLLVGPLALRLPIVVFTFFFEVEIAEAYVRLTPTAEGGYDAVLGGWAPVEEIVDIARGADNNGSFERLFGDGIRDSADLRRDAATGLCTAMSLAATFRTVPAFQF